MIHSANFAGKNKNKIRQFGCYYCRQENYSYLYEIGCYLFASALKENLFLVISGGPPCQAGLSSYF